ncbi:MAG: MotA/TolQ/ExbB proton channel family protein [Vicinamibacterales bacterium]
MRAIGGAVGLVLGLLVVAWAHVSMGGDAAIFMQPEAFVVVFGGTAAALLVSYPASAIRGAVLALADLATRQPPALDVLVPTFMTYARKARRQGLMAIEDDIEKAPDGFLQRSLTVSVTGLPAPLVREALDIDARVCAEREDEHAQILEAAAGYAPTLGIVGAVLGLMRVMQSFTGAEGVGAGIAAAFVATVYGVGAANLVFLPLATRLRGRSRHDALRRELIIDGVLALRDGASPGVVEERLAGYLSLKPERAGASGAVGAA